MAETVRVVHAPAGAPPVEAVLAFTPGMTLADAVRASGISARCPQLNLAGARLGIWGHPRDPATLVHPGDRVEIYRPLTADPKTSRTLRAKKKGGAK